MIDEAPRVEIPRTTLHRVRTSKDSSGDVYASSCKEFSVNRGLRRPRVIYATAKVLMGFVPTGSAVSEFFAPLWFELSRHP